MDNFDNPYASPAEPEDGGPLMADLNGTAEPIKPYTSAKARARWTIFFLAVILVGNIASGISDGYQIDLLQRTGVGDFMGKEAPQYDTIQLLIIQVLLAATIGSMISFLMWFYRSHRNLPSLGSTALRFTPGWAVGWWFVPIYSLVRPFQVMKEIWRGSDPSAITSEEKPPRHLAGLILIGLWWGLFLAMSFSGYLASRFENLETSTDGLILAKQISIIDCGVTVFAALLAILVVRRVTSNQEKRFRLLGESGDGVQAE